MFTPTFHHQSIFLDHRMEHGQPMDNHLPLKKRVIRPFEDAKSIGSYYHCEYGVAHSPHSTSETCSVDSGFSEISEPLDLSITSSVDDQDCSNNDNISDQINQRTTITSLIRVSVGSRLVCPSCNKIYESNARYRAHIRRHESKQSGRYQCNVCLKNFVQRSSLRTHERIHTGEKPYHCLVCGERFGDFSTFTKHRRTHTGEKPYACPVCSRSFSQSGNMHRHLKVVHRPRPNLYQQIHVK